MRYYGTLQAAQMIGKSLSRTKDYCKALGLPIVGNSYVITEDALAELRRMANARGKVFAQK